MGKTIMGAAAVSLDGFIADDNDGVGPLFEPDHDRARRPGHPPGIRRQALRPVAVGSCRSSRYGAGRTSWEFALARFRTGVRVRPLQRRRRRPTWLG
jgi:hypothetical protein